MCVGVCVIRLCACVCDLTLCVSVVAHAHACMHACVRIYSCIQLVINITH